METFVTHYSVYKHSMVKYFHAVFRKLSTTYRDRNAEAGTDERYEAFCNNIGLCLSNPCYIVSGLGYLLFADL